MAKNLTTSTSTHNNGAASVMARILATENISVIVDRKASTAAFDLKNRTLILPEWRDMSRNVFDMLIGHEISHALHTPTEGWRNTINAMSGTTDTSRQEWQIASLYLNVVEDARIERLIKDKFPGFKRDFVNAYSELSAKDFFGIGKMDMNALPLADRLNLYYKLGTIGSVGIRFTAEEQQFITRIDASQSFEDAAAIAADLYEYCKHKKADKQDQPEMSPPAGAPGNDKDDNNPGKSPASGDKSEKGKEKGEANDGDGAGDKSDGQGSQDGDPSDKQEESQTKTGAAPGNGSSQTAAPTPITQQSLNNNLQNSVAKMEAWDNSEGILAPTELVSVDLDKVVIDCKKVLECARTDVPAVFNPTTPEEQTARGSVLKEQETFIRESKRTVDLLIKQFELRKAAQISKRASIAKTGVLDMTRIATYKFNEDLFRRNVRLPEGKNHGLVMYVDWSGSMGGTLMSVLEQCFVLVEFCRRAGIPFDVYAFTTRKFDTADGAEANQYATPTEEQKQDCVWNGRTRIGYAAVQTVEGGMQAPHVHPYFSLINLFSSRMRKSEIAEMMLFTRAFARRNDSYYFRFPNRWHLSGTALDESIVAAIQMVPQFRDQNRLDIVHTIWLTDGDTSCPYLDHHNGSATIIDPKTRAVYSDIDIRKRMMTEYHTPTARSTDILLTAFRDITGSRAIGMFLCGSVPSVDVFFRDLINRQAPVTEQEMLRINPHAKSRYYFKQDVLRKAVSVVKDSLTRKLREDNVLFADKGSTGYDEFFIIRANTSIMEQEDVFDKVAAGASQAVVKRAFLKSFENKNKSRVLVNRFIEMIAR
jgi:hypothetical protein